MVILMTLSKVFSLNSEQHEMEFLLLKQEVEQLRIDVNHTALISHFTELMYDSENEEEVLSILLYAVQQILPFEQVRYFSINKQELILKEEIIISDQHENSEKIENGYSVPLNFLGGILADSVLQQETITLENGIEEGDELSLQYNCDNYMVVPLVTRSLRKKDMPKSESIKHSFRTEEEYLHAYIKSEEYPVFGAFWLNTSSVSDASIASSISLITSLVHTAGGVIGEIRMVDRITAINERIEKDLHAAREVQMGLLPASLPNNETMQATAKYLTEGQVGGDYYDIFELSPEIYGIMVADASGHGTPSALIMTMTKILLKTFADVSKTPSETLELINTAIVNNAKTNKFITGFYAILDTSEHVLYYTSAGHCPQILLNKNTLETNELSSDGLFIGMFPFLSLETHQVCYTPGENRLLLYTDGLTESTNNDEKMYGFTRLINNSVATAKNDPKEAIDKILHIHERYIRNHPMDDDLTVMIVDF